VLLGQFSVDELRVIAIVSGIGTPRAMLIDPQGVGTIVRRGDYVGRGEVVRGGPDGSSEFEVNWRVANIRRGDVVLAREDPTSAAGTPVTRVLPLHTGDEEGESGG
jgi:type IV pilus assembly protein PilP